MTLTQLQYFVTTARELHFGRSAKLLHITQPSLSLALANLENELGLALFERRGHRVTLTEAGEALLPRASALLSQADGLRRQMDLLRDGVDDAVCLSYTSTALEMGLPDCLARFAAERPGVRLAAHEVPTPEAVQGLTDGRYDLSLCMKVDEPALSQTLLRRTPYVLAVPPDSPLCEDSPREALETLPFITYASPPARAFVEGILREAGLDLAPRYTVYGDLGALRLAANGLGAAVVCGLFCREGVKILRPAWLAPYTHDLYLTKRTGRRLGRAAEELEARLLELR